MAASSCVKGEDTLFTLTARLGPLPLSQDMVRLTNFLPARFAETCGYLSCDPVSAAKAPGRTTQSGRPGGHGGRGVAGEDGGGGGLKL